MSGGPHENVSHNAGAAARCLNGPKWLLLLAISLGLPSLALYPILRAPIGELLGLPTGTDWSLGYFAPYLAITLSAAGARPANRAQWAILAAIVAAEAMLAAIGLAGGAWLLVMLYPAAAGGVVLHFAAIAVSALLVLPAIHSAYCIPDRLDPWPRENWRFFGFGRGGAG